MIEEKKEIHTKNTPSRHALKARKSTQMEKLLTKPCAVMRTGWSSLSLEKNTSINFYLLSGKKNQPEWTLLGGQSRDLLVSLVVCTKVILWISKELKILMHHLECYFQETEIH